MGLFTRWFRPGKQLQENIEARIDKETKDGNVPKEGEPYRGEVLMHLIHEERQKATPSAARFIMRGSLIMSAAVAAFYFVLENSPPLKPQEMEDLKNGLLAKTQVGMAVMVAAIQGMFSGMGAYVYRNFFLSRGQDKAEVQYRMSPEEAKRRTAEKSKGGNEDIPLALPVPV